MIDAHNPVKPYAHRIVVSRGIYSVTGDVRLQLGPPVHRGSADPRLGTSRNENGIIKQNIAHNRTARLGAQHIHPGCSLCLIFGQLSYPVFADCVSMAFPPSLLFNRMAVSLRRPKLDPTRLGPRLVVEPQQYEYEKATEAKRVRTHVQRNKDRSLLATAL